ncbi:MAG: HK97 family phage prohead protease [Pseudomonadota bacterium]
MTEPNTPSETTEVRGGGEIQLRMEGEAIAISGYAAVFDQRADIVPGPGGMAEVIRPGAFARALREGQDVDLLVAHAGLPLARSSSGTLTLSEDATGLRIEATLDSADPDVARLAPKLRRGDLRHMSFGFRAVRQSWQQEEGDRMLRSLEDLDLREVSVVARPAYGGTSVALRSAEAARAAASTGFDGASPRALQEAGHRRRTLQLAEAHHAGTHQGTARERP